MASSRAADASGALDPAALIARLERAPFSAWHLRARVVVGSATFFDAFDAPPCTSTSSRRRAAARTLVVWTLWACAYFITNGLNNWMPTLYSSVYQLSLAQPLRAGTLTNVAQVVILLGCAFAIERVGRRRWTVAGFLVGAGLLGMLGTFAAHSVVSVIALVTVSYGVVGSVNAVLYLYTPEIYPTRMRAVATGLATCWLRLASAVGPVLVGYLVARSGTGAVFLMFAAAGVIGGAAALAMLETRNRRLEELAP